MGWIHQELAAVDGITATTVVDVPISKMNDPMFRKGVFGISTSEYTAGQFWVAILYTHIGRANPRIEIGRSEAITGVSSLPIPLANASGATQTAFMGIPRVMEVAFAGTSAGVGITFSGAITASLYNP